MASYRELAERALDAWKPVYRGYDEMAAYWRTIHEPWTSLHIDMQRFTEGDDWAIMEFRFRAKGAESGADVDMTFCNAVRLRDGRITQIYARRGFDEAGAVLDAER